MRLRIGLGLVMALCVGVLLAPGVAQAKFLKAIWGPYYFPAGNAQCPTTSDPCSPFPVYKELGVDVVHFQLGWDEVAPPRPEHPKAPNAPAYDWSATDTYVAKAQEYGMQ